MIYGHAIGIYELEAQQSMSADSVKGSFGILAMRAHYVCFWFSLG